VIIFLNGAGSSGKSSIAKNIKDLANTPLLTISIDTFIDMMPDEYTGFSAKAKQGFEFVPYLDEDEKPAVEVNAGEFANKILQVMPRFLKLLADAGFDFIMDEVLFGDEQLTNYAQNLSKHFVYFIGVKCSLEVMEEREVLRGDRAIGLSRDQHVKVHTGLRPYDFEVDTTSKTSLACAKEILEFVAANPKPAGFKKIEKNQNNS
jgi:chloramphenicol 3-O phosphotransferase